MDLEDAIKTAFTIGNVVYYSVYMPFGLKNAEASFQQEMIKVFTTQTHGNLKAYMDDIVIKRMAFASHLKHLEETFDNMQSHNIRLNPVKCFFRVS